MSSVARADSLPAETGTADVPIPRVQIAVVIPAFDEHEGIGVTVTAVRRALGDADLRFDILVVDDGSSDGTGEAARREGARVVRLPENTGYGAAIKAGVDGTDSPLVAIIDGDGTYPADTLPQLIGQAAHADMVVGARSPGDPSVPTERRPGKWMLARLASYLAGRHIPDLNSGLRVMRRSVLRRFLHVLPPGFSFTTTLTLALLCTGHRVAYQPIVCRPRVGRSKIRARDFMSFVMLVLRTIVLFNPLRVFLPLGGVLFLAGTAKFVYDVFLWNLSESAVMAILAAIVVWSVGLLADMIARLQLRPPGTF
jgi:glycosyltransferase involved in cell wall biosynthesis